MAKWISGQPYTRFRAIRLKDAKLSFKSGAYNGLLTIETLTADRTWTLPNETGELLTRASESLDGGSIIITSDSSTYARTLDLISGTTDIYINRVEAATGNTDSTISISGALSTDLVFLGLLGTSQLAGGTLNVGSAFPSVSRSELWHVQLQNIGALSLNPAATTTIGYLVIS